jgi:hypothetical protein
MQLWYGMVCFICISISSLVGRRVCPVKALTSWKLIGENEAMNNSGKPPYCEEIPFF